MRARSLLKRLLPPLIVDVLRAGRAPDRGNWRGVYPTFSEVPKLNPEFGDGLIGEMAAATQTALDQIHAGKKPYLWHEALALVAGGMVASRERVSVLDFGGGLGTGYLQLITCLPPATNIEYLIVDNERMCERGQALFQGHNGIRFSTKLPDTATGKPDIVYVNSVLQYVENYPAQLRALAAFKAHYILLARLAAGECTTFASQQVNVPGQILPHWFLNAGEVTRIMEDAGYRLVCDELTKHAYDQSALPPTHRAERFRHMLFVTRKH